MLTVREVARRLQVTEESVRRWLRGGLLRGVPLRGRAGWRIPEAELRRFIEERARSLSRKFPHSRDSGRRW